MFGKLLGAIVGLCLGLLVQGWVAAIVLAVVGLYIGHRVDELHAAPELLSETEPLLTGQGARPHAAPATREVLGPLPAPESRADIDARARAHFARHVSTLFAELARADGEVVRDEVRVVRTFFETELGFTPRELELVRVELKAALAEPGDLDAALARCREEMRGSERLLLLDALYELALADGALRRSERELLKRIAEGLGIRTEDVRSIAALHLGDGAAAYERLGVSEDATDDEVRSAWRRLAAASHPDRVAHLGPGAVELASRRFRELQEAWEEIRKLRGL